MKEKKSGKSFKDFFNEGSDGILKGKKIYLITFILLIGLLLIQLDSILGVGGNIQESTEESEKEVIFMNKDLEADDIEKRLEAILSQVKGTGQVTVMLTYEGSSEYKYAEVTDKHIKETTETDQTGGNREIVERSEKHQLILPRNSQGQEEPVLIREEYPNIKGVVVVAEGANNIKVKESITYAVQTALGIGSHRITVLPRGD